VAILRQVVRATAAIFGGFPFPRYLFIIHALPVGSGGLVPGMPGQQSQGGPEGRTGQYL